MFRIDLNCDMGESFGAYKLGMDEEILKYVTSANIACGYHAGDPATMRQTVKLAIEHGVGIGAHPGLPDLVGFGRRNMDISPRDAYDIVVYQIGALNGFVQAEGSCLQHVKAHGALYNMASVNKGLAEAIAEAVYRIDPKLILFGLSGSEVIKAAERIGLQTASEVFADRTYQENGTLTDRRHPNALINESVEATNQVIRMVKQGIVHTQQGVDIKLKADTVCIHGDGVQAVEFACRIRELLFNNNISVISVSKKEVDDVNP